MPTSPIVQAQIAIAAAICLLAFWKGGSAERIAGALILANVVWGLFMAKLLTEPVASLARLADDGILALAMLALLLRFGAPWLGVAMLLYAAQFSLHSYYLVVGRPANDQLHAIANNAIFMSIILCLLVGTVLAWRRRIHTRSAT